VAQTNACGKPLPADGMGTGWWRRRCSRRANGNQHSTAISTWKNIDTGLSMLLTSKRQAAVRLVLGRWSLPSNKVTLVCKARGRKGSLQMCPKSLPSAQRLSTTYSLYKVTCSR